MLGDVKYPLMKRSTRVFVQNLAAISKLAELRQIVFPVLGLTTNERAFVLTRVLLPGYREYRENQLVRRAGVVVSTVHVVGNNNSLDPWTGLGQTAPTPAQLIGSTPRSRGSTSRTCSPA
jgi:hypothetical protein